MNPLLLELAQDTNSADETTQHDALMYIGLLLEKSSFNQEDNTNYQKLLPSNILAITLDESDQKFLVDELCKLIRSETPPTGALWAIGKARSGIGLKAFLSAFRFNNQQNEEVNWQALITLDNFLIAAGKMQDLQEQNYLIDEFKVVDWLQDIVISGSPRIKKTGRWLLEKIASSKSLEYAE